MFLNPIKLSLLSLVTIVLKQLNSAAERWPLYIWNTVPLNSSLGTFLKRKRKWLIYLAEVRSLREFSLQMFLELSGRCTMVLLSILSNLFRLTIIEIYSGSLFSCRIGFTQVHKNIDIFVARIWTKYAHTLHT